MWIEKIRVVYAKLSYKSISNSKVHFCMAHMKIIVLPVAASLFTSARKYFSICHSTTKFKKKCRSNGR
jgi:hypothetical protein